MTYLGWYLVAGGVVLALSALVASWRAGRWLVSPASTAFTITDGGPVTPWQRILYCLVVTVFAVIVLALWPVLILLELRTRLSREAPAEPSPAFTLQEREFRVSPEDLREQLLVQEIEQRECVSDPLGAVPEMPFGHLHPAWLVFLEQRGMGDALWSFSTHWTTSWGHKELREGYVIVREGAIGQHFLTVWRSLEVP